MADTQEVLTMMKDVAKSRIQMLRDGVTFHDSAKREYYLQEYERKLRDTVRRAGHTTGTRLDRPLLLSGS